MTIRAALLCVGRIKEKYWTDAVAEYEKRLSRYGKWEIIQVEDEKDPQDVSLIPISLRREGDRLLSKIKDSDYVIALCVESKQMDSIAFSRAMEAWGLHGRVVFVIGGSNGLDPRVIHRANETISFSKMTFPHQLMRVIFLEQAYRAMRIANGEPYHK